MLNKLIPRYRSIFFITTYFSDYILVPSRSQRTVTKALEQRGFVFSQAADAFVSQLSPSSPTLPHHHAPLHHHRQLSSSVSSPSTPPAKDIPELQTRTFTKLKRHNIRPQVDRSLRLVNCAGNRDGDAATLERLKNDLLQVFLATTSRSLAEKARGTIKESETESESDQPAIPTRPDFSTSVCTPSFPSVIVLMKLQFLSITITTHEQISILLEQRLLSRLGSSLLGAKQDEDTLVPITLDLRGLGMDVAGIVCGVAGGIEGFRSAAASMKGGPGGKEGDYGWGDSREGEEGGEEGDVLGMDGGPLDITFLSTVKAGTVLVKAGEVDLAVRALEIGMREVETKDGRE
jgi:hypothetical protein